jgi:hypothetical protein
MKQNDLGKSLDPTVQYICSIFGVVFFAERSMTPSISSLVRVRPASFFSHLRRGSSSWGPDPVIETNAQLLQLYNGREQFSISRRKKIAANVGLFVINTFKASLMRCQFHFFLNIWL